jgi:hypothetical protein
LGRHHERRHVDSRWNHLRVLHWQCPTSAQYTDVPTCNPGVLQRYEEQSWHDRHVRRDHCHFHLGLRGTSSYCVTTDVVIRA